MTNGNNAYTFISNSLGKHLLSGVSFCIPDQFMNYCSGG